MQSVPRLSHVRREIAQGSPTALIRARIKHEKRAEKTGAAGISDGASLLSSSVVPEDDAGDATLPQVAHVQRLQQIRAKLRDQRAGNHDTGVRYLAAAATVSEDLSWGASSPSVLDKISRLLQRVGRGYLLRSFHPQSHSSGHVDLERSTSPSPTRALLHRHQSPQKKDIEEHDKLRGASVSFVGSDNEFTPSPFQKTIVAREKALRGVYSLAHLTADELDGMIDEAKKSRDRSAWKRLASPQVSRLQRSASTLFLAPPEEPSAKRKPTERENIRQTLMKVEIAMKQRLADLDKKTREAQRVQDLKMLDLARDEAIAHERQRQAKAQAREQARATRHQHREEERARESEAVAERKALQREYDIKRVEVHVELRQKYMLEDRVTALRNTLSELTNISHLSSSVPSLNLTQATKEAHFRAEGLVCRPGQDDP
jgi:hypothetical protein